MIPYDFDGIQRPIFTMRLSNGTSDNLAVDGSVIPESFRLQPLNNQIMRVASWFIYLQDEKGFNITEFASTGSELANGLTIKGYINNEERDLLGFNIKSNADIMSVAYNMDLKTFGNLDDVLMAKWNFTEAGQFVRLDGSQGEYLEVVVNDNLTNVSKIIITAQGYFE